MNLPFSLDSDTVVRLCERYGVARLQIFGSVLTDHFDPESSDVDILVTYKPEAERTFHAFFSLRNGLENAVGRPVDLVDANNLHNPYIIRTVMTSAQDIYAA
ncbi:nucleotidyltransferase domain-containing protein [Actinomyces israelii]|uniref:Nucleotidyltransferase domain-containing protein n=1 Tax=Actinomyces israelii TaxID=1659 RepID=A0ABT4I7B3_9ACTO|nr:nucleotidyltransferase domain-containing protein [Actinomyces israelii]MCZ0857627.1 nucleotidyltransferase domain-containing protein [Actinomyces israelii]WKR21759.1 hypothetical protein AIF0345_1684 [Actinomyces israelii]